VRGPKREIISRCYNLILKSTLAARFSDAQCGFKAIRADVAEGLLPYVADTGWFFDTELPVLAERSGLRIHEVPVGKLLVVPPRWSCPRAGTSHWSACGLQIRARTLAAPPTTAC
jgi:hypothetical protein